MGSGSRFSRKKDKEAVRYHRIDLGESDLGVEDDTEELGRSLGSSKSTKKQRGSKGRAGEGRRAQKSSRKCFRALIVLLSVAFVLLGAATITLYASVAWPNSSFAKVINDIVSVSSLASYVGLAPGGSNSTANSTSCTTASEASEVNNATTIVQTEPLNGTEVSSSIREDASTTEPHPEEKLLQNAHKQKPVGSFGGTRDDLPSSGWEAQDSFEAFLDRAKRDRLSFDSGNALYPSDYYYSAENVADDDLGIIATGGFPGANAPGTKPKPQVNNALKSSPHEASSTEANQLDNELVSQPEESSEKANATASQEGPSSGQVEAEEDQSVVPTNSTEMNPINPATPSIASNSSTPFDIQKWIALINASYKINNTVYIVSMVLLSSTVVVLALTCIAIKIRRRRAAKKRHFTRLVNDLNASEKFTLVTPSDDESD